jgi:hypothetical protein
VSTSRFIAEGVMKKGDEGITLGLAMLFAAWTVIAIVKFLF